MKQIKEQFEKFNQWMNYNPPIALTIKEWRLFKEEFRYNAPIRFWIKDILHKIRFSFMLPIKWKYENISRWIRYRTYDRYHVVKTGLSPGYHDVDTIFINTSFNILKDFVEIELAWRSYIWSEERNISIFEKYLPFYRILKPFRSREMGLKHLNWAAALDDPNLPIHERSDHQAVSAREIRELYLWWVDIRPNRKEIELPEYDDQGLGSLSFLDDDFDRDAPDYAANVAASDMNKILTDKWKTEDDEMFIRLVKIRSALWT